MTQEYVVKNVKETQEVMASLCLGSKDVISKKDEVMAFVSKGWHGGIYYPESTEILIKVV